MGLTRGTSGYDAVLRGEQQDPERDLAGFIVVMRSTTAADWEHEIWVGNVREFTLKNTPIDQLVFGVKAVDRDGHESPVSAYVTQPSPEDAPPRKARCGGFRGASGIDDCRFPANCFEPRENRAQLRLYNPAPTPVTVRQPPTHGHQRQKGTDYFIFSRRCSIVPSFGIPGGPRVQFQPSCLYSQAGARSVVSVSNGGVSELAQKTPEHRDAETAIHAWGEKIFSLVDKAAPPALFTKTGLRGALIAWAMRDEQFKNRLFRLVAALPTLNSSEISRHLRECLSDGQVALPASLRAALRLATAVPWLLGPAVRAQVRGLARQFMLGDNPKQILAALRGLHQRNTAFTVDVIGEAVVSEADADRYAARCSDLLALLGHETSRWPPPRYGYSSSNRVVSRVNLSVKISALHSQIHPADPEPAIEKISARLRPILRQAQKLGAFVNVDMENYALKNLTLELFKRIFAEPEFVAGPDCGLAIQAYLKDAEVDLKDVIQWSRLHHRRITIRLVKGAYWDQETLVARQKGRPVPVFELKAETDWNFEKLSLLLLENRDTVDAAFATHNVRSIAHALAQAERLGIERHQFEFQMLYGMAEPIKSALLELDCRLREYCPVGGLLPGMAYLVRRLVENTSNEGFLASRFAKGKSSGELLKSP